jgi:hypothetical protein
MAEIYLGSLQVTSCSYYMPRLVRYQPGASEMLCSSLIIIVCIIPRDSFSQAQRKTVYLAGYLMNRVLVLVTCPFRLSFTQFTWPRSIRRLRTSSRDVANCLEMIELGRSSKGQSMIAHTKSTVASGSCKTVSKRLRSPLDGFDITHSTSHGILTPDAPGCSALFLGDA